MKPFHKTLQRLAALAAILFTLLVPATALAEDVTGALCSGGAAASAVCQDAQQQQASGENPLLGPEGIVTTGVKVFILIVGIITVIMFMISGIRLITSSGDANTVTSARNGIIYAAIGIIIVVLGQVIVSFVLTKV